MITGDEKGRSAAHSDHVTTDRFVELAEGLSAPRRHRLHRSTAKTIANKGIPVTPWKCDRLPRGASTAGSRRCTRTCTRVCWPPLRHPTTARRPRAAFGNRGVELVVATSIRSGRPSRSAAGSTNASSRSIRRALEVRASAQNHPVWPWSPTRSGNDGVTRPRSANAIYSRRAQKSVGAGFSAHRGVRQSPSPAGWRRCWAPTCRASEPPEAAFPALVRPNWRRSRCAATASNPHQQAALYNDPIACRDSRRAEQLHEKTSPTPTSRRRDAACACPPSDHERRACHHQTQPLRPRDLVGVGRRRHLSPRMRSADAYVGFISRPNRGQRGDGGIREPIFFTPM